MKTVKFEVEVRAGYELSNNLIEDIAKGLKSTVQLSAIQHHAMVGANVYVTIHPEEPKEPTGKTLTNTTASQAQNNVKDIEFWGNGDTFKLISKASSKSEGWMKSTKAMEIFGVGCVVQVTTQQHGNVAEAVTFVPNVRIVEEYAIPTDHTSERKVVGRRLEQIPTVS